MTLHVDRTGFLLFCAALAAASSHCAEPAPTARTQTPIVPVAPVGDTTHRAVGGDSSPTPTAPMIPADATGHAAVATASPVGSALLPGVAGASNDDDPQAQLRRLVTLALEQQGPCDDSPVEQARAEASHWHLEEMPSPMTAPAQGCQRLREPPGPTCEDYPLVVTDCSRIVSLLAPTAAHRAMACIARASGTRAMCNQRLVGRCARAATRGARAPTAMTSVCRETARLCADPARAEPGQPRPTPPAATACTELLASVRCWALEEMASCLAERCSIDDCIQPIY